MTHPSGLDHVRPDRLRALTRFGVGCLAAAVVAGCSSHRAPSPAADPATTGRATVGALTITGGYIPQPASPDVAAAYLTITNGGTKPDTITKISTSVTNSVMAMNETDHNGVGTMTDLPAVTIPAHGHVALSPGHAHLMLENPTRRLRAGQHVTATITFKRAGTITLTLPVVPLTH